MNNLAFILLENSLSSKLKDSFLTEGLCPLLEVIFFFLQRGFQVKDGVCKKREMERRSSLQLRPDCEC